MNSEDMEASWLLCVRTYETYGLAGVRLLPTHHLRSARDYWLYSVTSREQDQLSGIFRGEYYRRLTAGESGSE